MPQLDFSTYSSQIFWLLVSFALLFLMVRLVAAPRLEGMAKTRSGKIGGDIAAAEAARSQEKAHDTALAAKIDAAQTQARAETAMAVDAARARAAASLAVQDTALKAREAEAAAELATASGKAKAELDAFAKTAAADMVKRLTGAEATPERVAAAMAEAV